MTEKLSAMERIVAQVDSLHSAPHVACEVLSLLRHDDFDTHELTGLLESDPALTTSILRLVNSSYFGIATDISSLQQAVMLLGSRALHLAVLSFGLLKQLSESTPAQIYQKYWKRSLTMAATATQLATFDDLVSKDVAYSGGLLADVGALVFAQVETDRYVPFYERHADSATEIAGEEELFGFNHTELGAYVLRKWNLPEDLCQAVLHHHNSPLSLSGLNFTVAVSNVVAKSLWTPDCTWVIMAQKLLQESFGLEVDGFITLATDIQRSVHENAELFSVSLDETIDCDKLLATARQKYMDVAMEAALDVDSMSAIITDHSAG